MWFPSLGLPISLLGLAAQVPLESPNNKSSASPTAMTVVAGNANNDFAFKEGPDVFSPKDLVELARPGNGVANPAGDLLVVSVSKYSLEQKKYV